MTRSIPVGPDENGRLIARFEGAVTKGVTPRAVALFREIVCDYYSQRRRPFAWRRTRDPYRILVSEIMLQQTQTGRVKEKYEEFITAFPDFNALAEAPLQKVLAVWQGMGYNRRAVALKELARAVVDRFGGKLPPSPEELMTLPGIGRYTASALAAFAFNKPSVLIETNIRTVFIHFFFHDRSGITDKEILPLVEKTLDREHPRDWYNALMDYGVMLKTLHPNPGRKSAHYKKQSPFMGSNRQLRGALLKALVAAPGLSEQKLLRLISAPPEKIKAALVELREEGFIKKRGRTFLVS